MRRLQLRVEPAVAQFPPRLEALTLVRNVQMLSLPLAPPVPTRLKHRTWKATTAPALDLPLSRFRAASSRYSAPSFGVFTARLSLRTTT